MTKYTSSTWMLYRRRIKQPQKTNQRLTVGKTEQDPMEAISPDGWAYLYAPQTVFTS